MDLLLFFIFLFNIILILFNIIDITVFVCAFLCVGVSPMLDFLHVWGYFQSLKNLNIFEGTFLRK